MNLFKAAVEAKGLQAANVSQTVEFKIEEGGLLTRDDVGKIQTQAGEKTWKCVYTKRKIQYSKTADTDTIIDTVPFGFIDS